MLGGIFTVDRNVGVTKTPFLGDLPYLGQPSSTYRVVEYVDSAGVHSGRSMFVKTPELTNIRPAPDPTPYGKADLLSAVAADRAKARITWEPA